MPHHYSTDLPVSIEIDDRFHRYGFAKRIAETILKRDSEDCIVIGLYGAWGEGKTSILNFIETELNAGNSISIRFNPWRYKGEEALLKQFFETIASELKAELLTKKEKKGRALTKWGQYFKPLKVPGIDVGQLFDNIGSELSSLGIEKLKNRISSILQQEQKRIVIFIDDIDRLDKEEIHAVFRLVKLNADFKNTTYVLSFDEKMVAEAIGSRFGEGSTESGKSFLEKIIQVPLHIPVVDAESLSKFCIEKLKAVFETNNITLLNEEFSRFETNLTANILAELRNPRQVIQYCNSVSFLVPLMKDHVNIVDLMLLEAVKVYYPKHYELIKNNPEYFVSATALTAKTTFAKDFLETQVKQAFSPFTFRRHQSVLKLFCSLFPMFNERINEKDVMPRDEILWHRAKSIASPNYFNNYFSFTGGSADALQNTFESFILNLRDKDYIENSKHLKNVVNTITPFHFLSRIRAIQGEFSWETARQLSLLLFENWSIFPGDGYKNSFGIGEINLKRYAIEFIRDIIQKHSDTSQRNLLAVELIKSAQEFEAVLLLEDFLGPVHTKTFAVRDPILNYTDNKEFYQILIDRALAESANTSLITAYPYDAYKLLTIWKSMNEPDVTTYLTHRLTNGSLTVTDLIKTYSETTISSSEPYPYKGNHGATLHLELIEIVDKQLVKTKILETFADIQLPDSYNEARGNSVTDMLRVQQFMFWLKHPDYAHSASKE